MATNPKDLEWWKKTTVYQIYPRSYKDSTGNGIGDLKGIISKLDYIKDLGVETIWFSPFYKSPQADFGYDIADYRSIAPEYGTMEDCDKLIKEIHNRDMKIVMDMVMNHTSDQHEWFLESRSSKDNPKRDWYIWRDGSGKDGKKPPNNWTAMIGGSAWNYDEKTDQWYYAQFLPFQLDLNYRNPEVKEEMLDTVRFWLKKGADGFRLDIINALFEDAKFRDNPSSFHLFPSDDNPCMPFNSVKYTINHPDTLEFVKELRSVVDEFNNPSRYLVGEVTGPIETLRQYCGGNQANGLHTVFLFKTLGAKFSAKSFREIIEDFEYYFKEPLIPVWVFSNHDRYRRISRLGDDFLKEKLNTALQLTVRGVPYIYYGEEIGMPQHSIKVKDSIDAVALKYKNVPQFIWNIGKKVLHESINRDECRTPMQWDSSPNAGFCPEDVSPWLPVHPDYRKINVEVEQEDPDSMIHCYKRFLVAREEYPALNAGSLTLLDERSLPKNVLGYIREAKFKGEVQKLYVYLNFNGDQVEIDIPRLKPMLIVSTTINSEPILPNKIVLGPYEGVVVQW